MSNEKVKTLNAKAKELERKNPMEALELAKEAYEIAIKENLKTGIAQSLLRIGRCLGLLGSYHEAISHLNKALEISKTLEESVHEVEILIALGNVHVYLSIYDNAIIFYTKALKIAKKDKLIDLEANLLNNIGSTYLDLGELDSASNYLKECLEKCKLTSEPLMEKVCCLNLGEVYFKKKDYDQAREYMLKSLESMRQIQYKIGVTHSLNLLGQIEKEINNYSKAFTLFEEALDMAYEAGNLDEQIDILIKIADIHIIEGQLERGIEKLHNALSITDNVDGNKFLPIIYSKLATSYEKLNIADKTLLYYRKFHDSINSIEEVRREERLRSISFQLELEHSQQETETYRELMRELEISYSQIQVVSEIGQNITSTLSLEKSFNRIYENINKLMKSTVLGIGLYKEEEDCIEFILYKEYGQDMPSSKIYLSSKSSWAVWSFKNKQEILINDVEKEYPKYLEARKASIGKSMSSVIFYPLIVENNLIGVVTVQSDEKNAYGKRELDTMKILASYIAIAINNAQKSKQLEEEIKIKEKTQKELVKLNEKLTRLSDLDGLTNIPNRRCFNKCFEKIWHQSIKDQSPVSLILMDVDKFKEYNDNYGHLKGDVVLKQIAKKIEKVATNYSGIAARYGGDEFVILLSNTNREVGNKIAQEIDLAIKSLAIKNEYSNKANIITVSIGCSTVIPKTGDKLEYLIHQSDEALYLSKRMI